jgi:mono/diheme cytochrome c family protein
MRRRVVSSVVVAVGLTTAAVAIEQVIGPQSPPPVIRSIAGKDSFEFYCSSCHGRDGSGNGPAADRLRTKPPDLRLLALQNGGEFPRERILAFVTNGDVSISEHRPTDMPPWGAAFMGLERSEALVAIRIANIVQYVESLQAK